MINEELTKNINLLSSRVQHVCVHRFVCILWHGAVIMQFEDQVLSLCAFKNLQCISGTLH